jgi:hypothetical protein
MWKSAVIHGRPASGSPLRRTLRFFELRLRLDSGRRGDRRAGALGLQAEARAALDRRDEDRGVAQQVGACRGVARQADVDASDEPAGHVRAARQRPRPQQGQLPPRELVEHPDHAARHGTLEAAPLENDLPAFSFRVEGLHVDAGGDDGVVPGEAFGGGVGRCLRVGDERIDAAEELLALRLSGWVRQPFGREEARHGDRLRVAEGEVGEARQARLEAVHHVVPA